MAEEIEKTSEKNESLIDPIYQKFVKGVLRAVGSTEFYRFYMDALSRAQNEFQFSNRKLIKTVDLTWVDAVEASLGAMQNIISNPRNIIRDEELIVNVANARKGGSETVRHLAQHSGLVEDFSPDSGEVRPSRLMQRYREDSIGIYENRLVYTAMENAFHFVKIRHEALTEAMSDEFGAKLRVNSDMDSATEHVHLDMFLHIKEIESTIDTDDKNAEVFARISRIYRVIGVFLNSPFAQQMKQLPRVKGKVTKTNVLKRNKDYSKMVTLFEFLRQYDDVGYSIKVIEQNPKIDENFERDIFHNIMFNYLILKGYLEDERDRELPRAARGKKKVLKPKVIREVIEELTEDYDLPDVEIRKVLIEELTKAQLMKEEAEERRRLVEEQAQRKKEEAERIRREKAEEKERIRREKEEERERIRREKEAELARIAQERAEREIEDRRRSGIFKAEIETFERDLHERLRLREDQAEAKSELGEKTDFADAAGIVEETERLKREEAERERIRRAEERERLKHERLLEEEREREEQRRIAEAEEAARREEEEKKSAEYAAKAAEDRVKLESVIVEIAAFSSNLSDRLAERARVEDARRRRIEENERRIRERRARKATLR